MNYILDFCVGSTLFLGVTAFFYFRQNRIKNRRNNIYGLMLIFGLVMLVFDFLAAVVDPYASAFPLFLLYLINIIFLFVTHACTTLFLVYTTVIAGLYPKMTKVQHLAMVTPLAIITILLLVSPFTTRGIFYLDSQHVYQHGACHIVLYISAFICILAGLICVICARKSIQKRKVKIVFLFVLCSFVAMLIQLFNSRLLVNSTAMAISITMMYFALQLPSEHNDPVTGLLNRGAITEIIYDLFEQNQKFSLIIIQTLSIRSLTSTLGTSIMDSFQKQISSKLTKTFANDTVFRTGSDTYCILSTSAEITQDGLRSILKDLPDIWKVNSIEIPISYCIVGLKSVDSQDANAFLTALDYFIHQHKLEADDIVLADESFFAQYASYADTETAVKNAIRKKELQIVYQPILDQNGSIRACEAFVRGLPGPAASISTSTMMSIAEQNGLIIDLDSFVLEQICKFISTELLQVAPDCIVSVSLSMIDCMQRDLPDRVDEITRMYSVDNSMLAFEVHENDGEITFPQVTESILALKSKGHLIIANNFGAGFTDFQLLTTLPISVVKIDGNFIKDARKEEKQRLLLEGILSVISRLGLKSVCEGIDTHGQSVMAKNTGCNFFQGDFCAQCMTGDDLIRFIKAQSFLDKLNKSDRNSFS